MNKLDYNSLSADDMAQLSRMSGAAYTSWQGMQHILLIAEYVLTKNVTGAFVQCGVAAGAMAGALAWSLKKRHDARPLVLFDSYDGIPLAGPQDEDQPGIGVIKHDVNLPLEERLISSGISGSPVDVVKQNMRSWDVAMMNVQYVKGWFQHTMPLTTVGNIALLHLDGDLYESTQCCLEHLYPRLAKGAVVVHDDYPRQGSRQALLEYFAAHNLKPEIRVEVDTGAAHWVVE